MRMFRQQIRNMLIRVSNLFKPTENIAEAKLKWNRLAENAERVIYTDPTVQTEKSFRESGARDVAEHFTKDATLASARQRHSIVLEVGCGVGRLSEFIAQEVGTLHAIDISEQMIVQAKKRLSGVPNIVFTTTDGQTFPLPDSTADAVFSFIVFQHMPSEQVIRRNVEEIARVLKKEGIAKIQLRGVPVRKDAWFYGPSFDRKGAERLIEGTGLRVLKTEGEGQKYFWLWLKKVA